MRRTRDVSFCAEHRHLHGADTAHRDVHGACGNADSATVALAGLLALGAASSDAQPAVRQVLMLQSFDRGNLMLDHFTGNFRVDLDQRAGNP